MLDHATLPVVLLSAHPPHPKVNTLSSMGGVSLLSPEVSQSGRGQAVQLLAMA